MRTLSLRISSTVLFSNDEHESLAVGGMIDRWLRRNFSGPVWAFPVNLPGTPYRRMLKLAEQIEAGILRQIDQRRAEPTRWRDVLSILVAARDDEQRGMTDMELVGQASILFGASYETTAPALTWTLFLLMQHPPEMAAVVDEVKRVLDDRLPTAADLPRLARLDNAIRESLRILPPVPFTIRAATQDAELNGFAVPRGSRVICSHYLTHHSADIYNEPQRFRPERWETINPGPYEYLPFSAGPRMCIGVPFALQAMKVSIAMILQRFRPQLVTGARIDRAVRITMSPRCGMPVDLFPQDGKFSIQHIRGNVHEMVDLPARDV